MTAIPIAFYAPLKSPDDPSPSGDRTMARLLLAALRQAGFSPRIASRLRTFEPSGDAGRQAALRDASLKEADEVVLRHAGAAFGAPRLWFTYHVYYKAPDWIGPRVAQRLGIPYVAAEATRAGKRAGGPWALAHEAVEAGLDRAEAVFAFSPGDRVALERARPAGQRIVDLPPFLDTSRWPLPSRRPKAATPVRLLTVAMMRPGDKLASYRMLAASLALLTAGSWTLDIAGDGPACAEVATLFTRFGAAVRLHGRINDDAALARLYGEADLFVWPAVNEAYGMALIEAQAMGCPVVAADHGGVASAMRASATGLLSAPGDVAAFAADVARLIDDPARRARMGIAAVAFVRGERSLDQAAAILGGTLSAVLSARLVS